MPKPVTPLHVEAQTHEVVTESANGLLAPRTFVEPLIEWSPENVERFRLGYACIWCWEPFEKPFPKHCSVCDFPCKELQMEVFKRKFVAEHDDGFDYRYGKALEEEARQTHVPKAQIVVPRSAKT